ncbi:MAG: hypothetical protein WDM78_04335 [Puia sp.]
MNPVTQKNIKIAYMNRKLRMGMVGGGKDALLAPYIALQPIWMAS